MAVRPFFVFIFTFLLTFIQKMSIFQLGKLYSKNSV